MKRTLKFSIGILVVAYFVFNYSVISISGNKLQIGLFIQSARAEGDPVPYNCKTGTICSSFPGKHCIGNYIGIPFDCVDMYSSN